MLFRLSYSWLKEYVSVPKNPYDLARQLSLFGPSIEKVEMAKHQFTKVVVGEIVSIEHHPNADKLRVAMVRHGNGAPLKIVCGAPNIKVGQKVPLALVGAVLPGGIKVGRREVRGVTSEGMLCSARELGVHDDHLGILVLHQSSKIGADLADVGDREDFILEVEPTTNRPDINSVIGVAREVHAITGKPLKNITIRKNKKPFSCPLTVKVLNKKLCPRFMAESVRGVSIGTSPWWLQERLARAGIRPINAAVDITNYVMLEYGQPLHVYDADKLGQSIIVRKVRGSEKILALDGRVYNLKPSHLVIADSKKPVAIAGVMGGEDTAVTAESVNVVIECANFDAVSVRRTSRDLQLFTEASRLFEKGLSAEAPSLAMARAIDLMQKICGGETSAIIDKQAYRYHPVVVNFSLEHLPRIIGVSVSAPMVKKLLNRLGFGVSGQGRVLKVAVPYWRDHDVREPEDLVEEVARIYGYHRLSSLLPAVAVVTKNVAQDFTREDQIRHRLVRLGFTEVLSYSMIREAWLSATGYPVARALKIANPLTNDLAFLRPSLLPSLVAIIEANIAHRQDIKIFEIAKIYTADGGDADLENYRQEMVNLCGLITQPDSTPDYLYRAIKGFALDLYNKFGGAAVMKEGIKSAHPFAAGLSVTVRGVDKKLGGSFGILDPVFLQAFGINQTIAAFEFPLSIFATAANQAAYKPVPKFPAVKRDISLAIGENIRYTDLVQAMKMSSPLLESVELFDIYRDDKIGAGKRSYAMHLIYRAKDRTLASSEIDEAEAKMLNTLREKFNVHAR